MADGRDDSNTDTSTSSSDHSEQRSKQYKLALYGNVEEIQISHQTRKKWKRISEQPLKLEPSISSYYIGADIQILQYSIVTINVSLSQTAL